MAVSAFKSTSKRGSHASPSSRTYSSSSKQPPLDDSGKKIPSRRSRSVSAAPRSYADRLPAEPNVSEYSTTMDNPLFGRSSSSSPESEKREGIIRTAADTSSCRTGRSMSRSSGSGKESSGNGARRVSGRSLSRGPHGCSESEVERGYISASSLRSKEVGIFGSNGRKATDEFDKSELTRNLQTWTSRHPASELWDTSSSIDHQSTDARAGGTYETVQSEVCIATSEIRDDLENAFRRKNHKNIAVENVTDVPIYLNPGAIELVSDIRREYAEKLEQSQERARKLRADLAVEEQREKELSRILKDIVPVPKSSETRKGRPRRKTSIERVKMSRRLEEEAINYFEECVSISTFDSSDLSSLEEPQLSSVVGIQPIGRNKIFPNEGPTFSASHFPMIT
ncbi:uncharacterized protein [Typha angustifolia]|uniref:uncharacterized protein n=1 Tax=Typha angustifolia TaxID=59011 RepID=UPI003C2EF620